MELDGLNGVCAIYIYQADINKICKLFILSIYFVMVNNLKMVVSVISIVSYEVMKKPSRYWARSSYGISKLERPQTNEIQR